MARSTCVSSSTIIIKGNFITYKNLTTETLRHREIFLTLCPCVSVVISFYAASPSSSDLMVLLHVNKRNTNSKLRFARSRVYFYFSVVPLHNSVHKVKTDTDSL